MVSRIRDIIGANLLHPVLHPSRNSAIIKDIEQCSQAEDAGSIPVIRSDKNNGQNLLFMRVLAVFLFV